MSIQATSHAASAYSAAALQGVKRDSDGDNDGSKAKSTSGGFGPAVVLSLSNASAKVNDAAQGDPDHDGH
jgi:hypothetical protein